MKRTNFSQKVVISGMVCLSLSLGIFAQSESCETNTVPKVTAIFDKAPADPNILHVPLGDVLIVAEGKDDEDYISVNRLPVATRVNNFAARFFRAGDDANGRFADSNNYPAVKKNPRELVIKVRGEVLKRFPMTDSMAVLTEKALRINQNILESTKTDTEGKKRVEIDLRDITKIAIVDF